MFIYALVVILFGKQMKPHKYLIKGNKDQYKFKNKYKFI